MHKEIEDREHLINILKECFEKDGIPIFIKDEQAWVDFDKM